MIKDSSSTQKDNAACSRQTVLQQIAQELAHNASKDLFFLVTILVKLYLRIVTRLTRMESVHNVNQVIILMNKNNVNYYQQTVLKPILWVNVLNVKMVLLSTMVNVSFAQDRIPIVHNKMILENALNVGNSMN